MEFQRKTFVVHGPLALNAERYRAARECALGREILHLPQFAARLAGGFKNLAASEDVFPAIRATLVAGEFTELQAVRLLPGTVRAVAASLDRIWKADLDLGAIATSHHRLADLAIIERHVREALPKGRLLPRDLITAAIARVSFAPVLFGAIEIAGMLDVDPVWRPLIAALSDVIEVTWRRPHIDGDCSWFTGRLAVKEPSALPTLVAESCADPRAEVVEALRWARERLSTGNVRASDIAVTATSTEAWDDHVAVLARTAELRVHFTHGRPALALSDGQAAAALSDILLHGLDQRRFRRLMRRLPETDFTKSLPANWASALPSDAGLFTVGHWREALAQSTSPEAIRISAALMPILELLAQGVSAAEEAGEKLFTGLSRELWRQALRLAPAEALAFSLKTLRLPDTTDSNASIVWGPSAHLAAHPRPIVRLLGFTSGAWPRIEGEDAVLPEHVLARRQVEPMSVTERDRQAFAAIRRGASVELVLSRARRNGAGSVQARSPLWPLAGEKVLPKTRVPQHAFSEADRLLARREEALKDAQVYASRQCWLDWRNSGLTAHDGVIQSRSLALCEALARVHSPTSLRCLLRDPLGFVWRYALGWRDKVIERRPLALSPGHYGELVHELIGRSVTTLEAGAGATRSSEAEREASLTLALEAAEVSWPLVRAVPPPLLWRATLESAKTNARQALLLETVPLGPVRSYSEVPFGSAEASSVSAPWNIALTARIGETGLVYGGRIDRLDVAMAGHALRITDYKTGKRPERSRIVLAGGRELQPVLYAMAARQLLPETTRAVARLAYVTAEPCLFETKGEHLEGAARRLGHFVDMARGIVETGCAVPGPDARETYHAFRLALPAEFGVYADRKERAFEKAHGALADLWEEE